MSESISRSHMTHLVCARVYPRVYMCTRKTRPTLAIRLSHSHPQSFSLSFLYLTRSQGFKCECGEMGWFSPPSMRHNISLAGRPQSMRHGLSLAGSPESMRHGISLARSQPIQVGQSSSQPQGSSCLTPQPWVMWSHDFSPELCKLILELHVYTEGILPTEPPPSPMV